jgi:hypothetical protein
VKNGEENIGEIELKSQIKAYSQKEWAFCFLAPLTRLILWKVSGIRLNRMRFNCICIPQSAFQNQHLEGDSRKIEK